ncbi:MAG: hypothetical protein JXK07_15385 [Spirochaetes bacterium]|nr:hypothetical protein [Spirochaetota bacterium]MBN2769351.1 hypothetical protein [Spirochaetota bacterium]
MKKVVFIGILSLFLIIAGCGPDLYDLANSKRTLLPSMQIDALFLQKTISNNDILPSLPIIQNATNNLQFLIANNGNGPLTITEADLDSDYFELSLPLPFTIDPGDEQQFTIDITPPGTTEYSSLIRLHSSDPDNPQFEFTLNAISYHGLVYVSSSASDSGNGTATNPYKSLDTAISNADNNDSIIIDSGTYDGSFAIDKPLNLIGNFRYNGTAWLMVPEDETEGRPVLRNSTATTDGSTVYISASPLSSEISLTSLNIYTPNASANASTVLIDSSTETSGAITIRNCNISNPDGYNSTGSSAAILLTNGTQSGTVSITDSFIRGGDSNSSAWGIVLNDSNPLVMNGFSFIIRGNDIEAGTNGNSTVANAGIYIIFENYTSSDMNQITNTTFDISNNSRICGTSHHNNSSTSHGIYVAPEYNGSFNYFKLLIQNNGLISGGESQNINSGSKYGIRFDAYDIPSTTTGSEIIIKNNQLITAHGPTSAEQPYRSHSVNIYMSTTTGSIPVTIYGNHIKAESNNEAKAVTINNSPKIICTNNIITSESINYYFDSSALNITGSISSEITVLNNLIYVLSNFANPALNYPGTNSDNFTFINNTIINKSSSEYCIANSDFGSLEIKNNYFYPEDRAFRTYGTSYNISSLESAYSTTCSDNFTTSDIPIFDSNWRLTSATVNNPLKSGGIMIPGLVSDISGDPRPGSDGAYAVGPYEY